MNATPITACLLHADYHAMDSTCWDATLTWYFDHATEPEQQRRDNYQAAVERRILDNLRTLATPNASGRPADAEVSHA